MRLEKATYASVAQLVEQETENLRVAGSTPARGTISWIGNCYKNPIIRISKPNLLKRPAIEDPRY